MALTGKLSAVKVQKVRGPAVLHDGGGLYLRVSAPRRDKKGGEKTCKKSWVYRFQLGGKRRDMGLGPFPDISLLDARKKADDARRERHDGADPLDARNARRRAELVAAAKGRTFKECAEDFIKAHRAGWRNEKHADQWTNTLTTYAYPILGELPVSAIDAGLVIRVLEPIWQTKPETASRVRGRIEAVLDSARVRGFRDGPNPAQWRGNLALHFPARAKVRTVNHHAALPIDDMHGFYTTLQGRAAVAAKALQFAILTATQTSEALGATWREVDLDASVWTIPGERMKGGREHRIPLSTAAVAVLREVRPLALEKGGVPLPEAPVFPGPRRAIPLSNMAFLMLLRRMKRDDLTAHGFRSTFRDWASERTSYPREVVEMALAHAIENKVEAAYRRGDLFEKRRRLMEAWATFSTTPLGGKVAQLRRRA